VAIKLNDLLSPAPKTLKGLLEEPEAALGTEEARSRLLPESPVERVSKAAQTDSQKTDFQLRQDKKQVQNDRVSSVYQAEQADQAAYNATGEQNLGWAENFKRNVANFPDRTKLWMGGIAQAFDETITAANMNRDKADFEGRISRGQNVGTDEYVEQKFNEVDAERFLAESRREGKVWGQELFEEARNNLNENAPNYGNDKFQFYVMEAGNAAAELAAATGASIITGTPTTGAALMGARVYGQTYSEARASGRTTEQSIMDASFSAFAEFIPERIALGKILSPNGGGILRRAATGAAAEGTQEMVTEALQIGYDMAVLNEGMTFGEAKERLIDAGVIGAMVGAPIGAAVPNGIQKPLAGSPPAGGGIDSPQAPKSFLQESIPDPRQDVPLSEADRASPLPDKYIQKGKNTVADALEQKRPLKPSARPQVEAPFDKMVQITLASESGNRDFNNQGGVLTSPAGARGKMQVMPGTQTDPGFGVRPAQNNGMAELARVGRDYLAAMMRRYGGDPSKAWAAYNWGPGALDGAIKKHGDGWLDHAPAETRAYVMKNLGKLGGAAFDPATGDIAPLPTPTELEVDSESAEDFVTRVLGSDFLDVTGADTEVDPAIAAQIAGVEAIEGTVPDAGIDLSAQPQVEPVTSTPQETAPLQANVGPTALPTQEIAAAPITPAAPVAVEPAAPASASEAVRIEPTSSGKGITVYGLNPGQQEAVTRALPEKVSALQKKDGGLTYSKKHEAKIRAALDNFQPIDDATVTATAPVETLAAQSFGKGNGLAVEQNADGSVSVEYEISGFAGGTLATGKTKAEALTRAASKLINMAEGKGAQSDTNRAAARKMRAFVEGQLGTPKTERVEPDNSASKRLVKGWSETSPGKMATNPDEKSGGIVDQNLQSGKWFVVPNDDSIGTLEGFDNRDEAFGALSKALRANEKTAVRPGEDANVRARLKSAIVNGTAERAEEIAVKLGVKNPEMNAEIWGQYIDRITGGASIAEIEAAIDATRPRTEKIAEAKKKDALTKKERAELDELDRDNENGVVRDDEDVGRRLDLKAKENPKPNFAGAVNKDLSNEQVDAVAAIFDNAEKREAVKRATEKEEGETAADKPKSNYGATNTLVTQDRAAELRAKIKAKLGKAQLNSGFDPELMAAGLELSAFHIEAGARKFGQYAKAIANDLDMTMTELKPYLRAWYNGARDFLEDSGQDVADMDGPGAVRAGLNFIEDTETQAGANSEIGGNAAETATGLQTEGDIRSQIEGAFIKAFENGEAFTSITQARQLAEKATGQKIAAGSAEAKILEEAIESAVVKVGRGIIFGRSGGTEIETYNALVNLYSRQPKLGTRTSTSVAQQAFSTPVPLAYLASRLGRIGDETSVYEPSAGNGALLIRARGENVTANELNPDRAEQLRRLLPDATVTENDAVEFAPKGDFDVVIGNPPFGAVKDESGQTVRFEVDGQYSTNEIDHAIAMKALSSMKDDGKAVLLVGGINKLITDPRKRADAYNGKAKREFYFKLYSAYNVTDHFTVDGSLYERQGAGWPVDVIVIDGRGKSSRTLPAVKAPPQFNSWDALQEKLNDRGTQKAEPVGNTDGSRVEQIEQPARVDAADNVTDGGRGLTGSERANPDGLRDDVRDGRSDGQSRRDGLDGDSDGNARAVENQQRGSAAGSAKPVINETAENDRQVAYKAGSQSKTMGTLVPVNMAGSIADALDLLEQRVGAIDTFVADRLGYKQSELAGYFGAEQVDAIALAIDNIERGAGFIIGDQTGIGKGRVVAAMIRYAIRQGRNPIFVTEKPNLYGDMYRDLRDIGLIDMLGRDMNLVMTDAGKTVLLDEDTGFKLKTPQAKAHNDYLQSLRGKKLADEGIDAIFTTYAQMQTLKSQETPRRKTLASLADGGVLMLDESHNAGGQSGQQAAKGDAPNRAEFVRNLVNAAHGVFYSSATYAKRPDVMDLYSATDMKLAVPDLKNLGEAISKGGVPMQQVVAAMLARAGQYVRRERSFEGISYNTPTVEIDRGQYANASTILKQIQDFSELHIAPTVANIDLQIRDEAKSVSADNSVGGAGAASTNFTSIMHNIIDQMLLAFTADAAADRAIKSIQDGEKPVITVANTLESFLDQYAEDEGVRIGEEIDITFADVFARYLERSRWITVKKPFAAKGEKGERIRLTDAQIGPNAVNAFKSSMDFIRSSGLDALPGSPLDHILSKIEVAGYAVGEITGRSLGLNYRNGKAYLKARKTADRSIAGRQKTINGYNSGKIDAILLNRSGSTGLSLHASEKFKDQRKRRMIIAQAEGNIDTHMQMLGRVHRTGQVVLPEYDQLVGNVPAQKRPAAVLAKKMASLNANTTASRDSALTSSETLDFMNEYGDEVVARIMEEEPDIHDSLSRPLKEEDEGYNRDGAARKVTGRIPLLPVEQQEELYQRIEDEYRALLAQKEAAGENALEAKTFPLDAEVIATAEAIPSVPGSTSPFAGAVIVQTVDVKRLGKPFSSSEVVDQVKAGISDLGIIVRDAEGKTATDLLEQTRAEQMDKIRASYLEGQDFMREQLDNSSSDDTAKRTRDRLEANSQRFLDIRRIALVGESIKIRTANGNFYGVVTDLQRTGNAKNPLALGSWKMTASVVDSARTMTFPLSQVETSSDTELFGKVVIEKQPNIGEMLVTEAFDSMQSESRENRMIVTGNLLAGFDYVNGNGAIINYTTKNGEVKQGIMMRRDFNLEKHIAGKGIPLTNAKAIVEWLRSEGGTITGQGSTGAVSLFTVRDAFAVTAARTKSAGGEFFLNQRLVKALGTDFVSKSTGMVAEADISRAEPAVQALLDSGVRFEVAAQADADVKERARAIAEKYGSRFSIGRQSAPQLEQFASTPATPREDSNWQEIQAKLREQVKKLGLADKVTLEVTDLILGNPKIQGSIEGRIIRIALNSVPGATKEFVVDHEIIHALKGFGLFKRAEWTALEKAARADKFLMASVNRRYKELGLTESQMVEEAIADMFAKWREGGTRPNGFIRDAMRRIINLFATIRNAIFKSGNVQAVEEILQNVASGEVGSRESPYYDPRTRRRDMVAYHGSPHDFDIFSNDAIGTGEGAQAYGYGIYFADKKSVAEFYRDKLTKRQNPEPTLQGKTYLEWKDDLNEKGGSWTSENWDMMQGLAYVRDARGVDNALAMSRIPESVRNWITENKKDIEISTEGKLFQVELPEEGEYLLWDAPLTEQSKNVREAIAKEMNSAPELSAKYTADTLPDFKGNMYYDAISGEIALRERAGPAYGGSYQDGRKLASKALLDLGIKGIKYLDGASRSKGEGSYNYVIFDAADVQVTQKFSIGENARSLIGNREAITDRLDVWRTNLQNRMLPLLRSQQRVELQTGETMPESMNPYLKEELMSGKVGARLEKLADELVQPLFDSMEAEGIAADELETYLYARHAPERNARISSINDEFAEGTGSGMTDAEAGAIMTQAELEGKLPALERTAAKLDKVLRFAIDTRVEAGLLSEEEADSWRANYQFYVPLRGRAELEPESMIGGINRGSGITVRGKESKRAFGRKSKAIDILAYSIMQAEEAVMRAGKNEVAQAFYNLAKSSPDKDFWTINKVARKPFFNDKTGTVSYRNQTTIQPEDEPLTVVAKFEGQERRVTMNRENPKAVQLAEAMRNLNGTDLGTIMQMLSSVNRFLSFVNTGLNPEFVITNAFRDLQTAGINLAGFDEKGLIKGTLKDYLPALQGSIRGAFKTDKGEWGKWYNEFVNEGGRVYFNRLDDLNDIQRRIEKQFSNSAGGIGAVKSGLFAVKSFIENANTGVENAVRLSAYKNAREAGMSKAQAASLAKNLTVNFNRRGAWGVGMNSLYLFYNASVQGSARLFIAMKHKRVQAILAGAVAMGFALDALNMMLSGDDDDGESFYDKISDFDKSRNLIVMIPDGGGKHIKIPLPYGYNAFFAMGRTASEISSGKRWQHSMASLLTTIVDSFNPIGGSDNIASFLSPTIGDPIVDLTRNRDFADRPIMPEQNQYGPQDPDNQRYWNSVSPHWRIMSQILNQGSGGDEVVPGYVDVSPETLEHISGYVTGAAGTFWIDRIGGLGQKVVLGEEITTNDIPMFRKVVGSKPSWYDKAAYYARVNEIEEFKGRAKEYRERGQEEAAEIFEDRSPDILAMIPEAKRAQKEMRAIRKQRVANQKAFDLDDIDEAEFNMVRDDLQADESLVIEDFNAFYLESVEKPKKP
tara:strand:- start:15152 stop:27736 length:12585 start_codon:yes stop_codon:yes gene_type:complete